MAPEETRTISRPANLAPASTATSCPIRCGSMPPLGVVKDEEPTLTTTRRAPASSSRMVTLIGQVFGLRLPGVVGPIFCTSTLGGGSLFDQPLILTAPAEDLRTALD